MTIKDERALRRRVRSVLAAAAVALLAACGGGGDGADDVAPPASCSVASQKAWLRDYFDDWYFWYRSSPRPDPAAYATVDAYFEALLYGGGSDGFPSDLWSYHEPQASHDRFYGEGRTLGYGLFVAGREVEDRPDLPLKVRYVEPKSPAALADVRRGDEVLSVNGTPASTLIADNDYAALTPAAAGDRLTLRLRRNGLERTVTLDAVVFDLTPVPATAVVDTGDGRRTGYLVLKDFIGQAEPSFETAFATFRTANVTELVIDLRYNGGGLVSTAAKLASYIGGRRGGGQVFAQLLYNDRHSDQNTTFRFDTFSQSLDLPRVYVLTGGRTCSASELVVNGLRPFVDVRTIGDTTCGKPVGFLPRSACGTTYSIVNFESVNARNEGRYFSGFQPTCAVADDLAHPLGSPQEALLATARYHARNNTCPVGTGAGTTVKRPFGGTDGDRAVRRSREPNGPDGMIGR